MNIWETIWGTTVWSNGVRWTNRAYDPSVPQIPEWASPRVTHYFVVYVAANPMDHIERVIRETVPAHQINWAEMDRAREFYQQQIDSGGGGIL